MIVQDLSKEGIFNEKEITHKFIGFRKSIHSIKSGYESNFNNTIGYEQNYMNHDEGFYQVKKGKIFKLEGRSIGDESL